MTYTASQNSKTRTTHTAAALFAILILVAGIAALAMHPAEAFAKPLCTGTQASTPTPTPPTTFIRYATAWHACAPQSKGGSARNVA